MKIFIGRKLVGINLKIIICKLERKGKKINGSGFARSNSNSNKRYKDKKKPDKMGKNYKNRKIDDIADFHAFMNLVSFC